MKKFVYRLQPIRDIKRYVERDWEQKLAYIQGQCLSLENGIKEKDLEKKRSFKSNKIDKVGIKGLLYNELYMNRLKQESNQEFEKLEEKRVKMNEVKKTYLKASMERKVFDKLKERREKSYYKEQLKEENKEIDDILNNMEKSC